MGSQNNKAPYALMVGGGAQSYADLRGKQFAVSDLQDGSTVLLRRLLAANGLQQGDYMVELAVLNPPAPPPEQIVDESYLRKATGQ